ncbi:MAG: hypothetical protein PHS31_05935 [Victivallaceae bacterium]|nr:hypothetical protein [Victivallaceae bacterium]
MQKVNHGELKGGTKYTKRELESWRVGELESWERVGKELGKSWERVGKELGKSWERVGKEFSTRRHRGTERGVYLGKA